MIIRWLTLHVATLQLCFHVINLYMHDFAMTVDCGPENVKASNARSIPPRQKAQPEVLTTAHVGALTTCLTSIHGMFDSFLTLEAQKVQSLPIFHFARLVRASVLLTRMYFAATTPDSELGKVLLSDHLKVEQYLRGLIDLLRTAARDGKCDPAYKASIVLAMMQVQFERSKEGKTGLVDEIEVDANLEARPVDTEKYSSKSDYQKLQQLEASSGGSHPIQPSPPKAPVSLQAPSALASPPPPASTMSDRALQVLSEITMNNPAANGHQAHNNGNDGWYGGYNSTNNPMETTTAAAAAASSSSSIYPSEYYPPPPPIAPDVAEGVIDVGVDVDVFHHNHHHLLHNMMHMHPGFEQAIGMTLGEAGDFHTLDDDGFYQIMQAAPTFFIGGGGGGGGGGQHHQHQQQQHNHNQHHLHQHQHHHLG